MCHYNQIKGNGKYNSIRAKARILYQQSQKPYVCYNCGYDKHVQICHLKPLHLFADDTLISIVNDLNNLIALCPNCHWELDNNILSLPAIGESNS
jgi:5-methylcytosine-specific restriction endonuclease McrA